MSKKITKLVLALGAMAMVGCTMAQSTATASVTASVTLLPPTTSAKKLDLNFGKTILPDQAGTVAVGADSAAGGGGRAGLKSSSGGTGTMAVTTLTMGAPN